ncbi:HNH endonuclease [Eubacteriales bacterium OttesenSCG-928-N13]|nr:HNH endonuclease [Eubacteriales bacterium OttesenSCG-928-N13]
MNTEQHYNRYQIADDGKSVIGYLPNGMEFYFDLADLEKVQEYAWYLCGYPDKIIIANRNRLTLHRYLLDCPDGEIDHVDLNRFNNRRSNLRYCTHRQNQCNHGLQRNNTSGAAGVRFYKPRNKYAARIKHFGQEIHLGYYADVKTAMQARNVAMELLFGEFARMNPV